MKISQRRTAQLGICAAAVVMLSSLGLLIIGGTDGSSAPDDQKTLGATPSSERHDGPAAYSVSVNVLPHHDGLPQP